MFVKTVDAGYRFSFVDSNSDMTIPFDQYEGRVSVDIGPPLDTGGVMVDSEVASILTPPSLAFNAANAAPAADAEVDVPEATTGSKVSIHAYYHRARFLTL